MAASTRPSPSTLEECDRMYIFYLLLGSHIDEIAEELRKIISNLFILVAQAHDYQGPGTQQAIADEM